MTDLHEINQNQATLLAHLIHEIRPDWEIKPMMSLLHQHRALAPLPALTIAAVKAASVPTNRTPAVIFLEGRHWENGTPQGAKDAQKLTPCQDHPEQDAIYCRCCRADIKTGHRPESHQGKHWDPESETP